MAASSNSLCRFAFVQTRRGFPTTNVSLLRQNIADSAPVDHVCSGNFMLVLTSHAAKPHINRLIEGELSFPNQSAVLIRVAP